MNYEQRLDFRAFDVLADAIEKGSPAELKAAHDSCREVSNDFAWSASKRAIFKDFAKLIKKHNK